MQKYKPQKVLNKRKKIEEFIIDETSINIGSKYVWLWVAIEPMNIDKFFILIYPLKEQCLLSLSVLLLHL